MTVTQLLAEICSRAGEGYQNYTDRAKAHFKTAVLTMLYSSLNPDLDAPSLYKIVRTLATSESSSIMLSDLLMLAGLTEGTIDTLRYGIDSNAAMTTTLADDNDIKYTARTSGSEGNLIGVEYILPSSTNSPLSFSVAEVDRLVDGETVTGYTITVNIATDGAGNPDTDAQQLLEYIVSSEANFYVSAALSKGVTGAGQITAMSEKLLTGGVGTGEYQRMERITKMQQDIARMNPNLLNSKDEVSFYFLTGLGNAAKIELMLPPAFNMNGTIEYSLIGWSDAITTPVLNGLGVDTTDLSTSFSPVFLENAIATASALLVKEIMA